MISLPKRGDRRLVAPEVVQTSAMDCGPAALKCLLEGFGVPVSYGRLREACQTDVDGTSIDTLELVANQLGLQAEQIMLPVDHLPLPEAEALPALLVVRQPNGLTHFVVVWRRHGAWLQIMDPAVGRRWVKWDRLREEIFVHAMPVPAAGWREWAGSADFTRPLERRLRDLGVGGAAGPLVARHTADPHWRPLALLDAAVRMVSALRSTGGVTGGRTAARLLDRLLDAASRADDPTTHVPTSFWSVRPAGPDPDGEDQVWLRGAVLLRIRGRHPAQGVEGGPPVGSPELRAALGEAPTRPLRVLMDLVRGDGAGASAVLLGALASAAGAVVLEALMLRGAMELGGRLGLVQQRLQAVGFFVVLLAVVLALELGVASALARLGRRLELRLRVAFLEKIPRLQDRYFQSRPVSDMAERSHTIHQIRALPRMAGQVLRVALQLLLTAVAVAILYPAQAGVALAAALVATALPLLMLPLLGEQDLRIRTHGGALARFQLDSLLGLSTIRSHGAEPAVQREHEGLLVEWARAGHVRLRSVVLLEAVQAGIGYGLGGWIFFRYLQAGGDPGGVLLLAYWALSLPVLGSDLITLLRQWPTYRNITLRLLEPLGAPEDAEAEGEAAPQATGAGVSLVLQDVSVRAAGHTILEGVSLRVEPGEHVAVVGPSGAGKSSLIGLLLGWHRPDSGRLLVDGTELTAGQLARLRQDTAWVDPAVQIWNRTLLDNLTYGVEQVVPQGLSGVLEGANLTPVLHRLTHGLQGAVGEGGGLLSGGEGQRVRLARAMLRWNSRLVILDEPFRGLDREQRRRLLRRLRQLWPSSTLICITHDVSETAEFDRVVVVDGGRIAADGPPAALRLDPGSRYAQLLDAERLSWEEAWMNPAWRRARLDGGQMAVAEVGAS